MSLLIDTTFPIFSIVLLGWLLAARSRLQLATLTDLALLVTSPALMFSVLGGADVDLEAWGTLIGGALWIVAGTALLAWVYFWRNGRRGVFLSAVFWNAGNLTLPLARLAFGEPGLQAAAVIFVTMAILNSTVGLWIAKGENGLSEVVRMPLVYGSVGGLILALSGQTLPRMLMEPIEMLGGMAIPLMLLNLGMQLRKLSIDDYRHSVVVVGIRVVGGLAFAALFVSLFGVDGVERKVLLLGSIMPTAVINVMMAQRYQTDPSLVASAVVLGTLLSLVTIPAILYFLT
ncbi:MAG: AEC family transporter [Myxococcota bacterium]